MDKTDDIPVFEIPADGQDQLAIGDFDFQLVEDSCRWGTGGLVIVTLRTTEIDRAVKSNLLYKGNFHKDGELKITFNCEYTYPAGVADQEFNFIDGVKPHPNYQRINVDGVRQLEFHGKATLLNGWLCLNGLLRDHSDTNRCWPIKLIRKRTPDPFDWATYEFSLEEAMQIHPELVSKICIRDFKGDSLPTKIREFNKLTEFSIFGAENLKELPEEIGTFTQLKYLAITDTLVEELPRGIFLLPRLQTLYIDRNKLQQIPENINLPNLRAADFGENELTTLPKSLANSKQLWRLVLEKNPWVSLPVALSDIKVVTLDIEEKKRLLHHGYKGADGKGITTWDENLFLASSDAKLYGTMTNAIKNTIYEDHITTLKQTALKAVCMRTIPMEDDRTLGNTRFGGLPDLPAGAVYPTFPDIYRKVGYSHHIFIAQLNCSELAPFQEYLPREGILYFYLQDEEEFECKVVYHPTTLLLQSAKSIKFEPYYNNPYLHEPSNPVTVEFSQLIALPQRLDNKSIWEYIDETTNGKNETEVDVFGRTFSESLGRMGILREHNNHYYSDMNHTINDHPYYETDSPLLLAAHDRKGNPEDWMVLLRVYSDDKCGFNYFDARELCFMIHKSDLAKGDFSNVFAAAGF